MLTENLKGAGWENGKVYLGNQFLCDVTCNLSISQRIINTSSLAEANSLLDDEDFGGTIYALPHSLTDLDALYTLHFKNGKIIHFGLASQKPALGEYRIVRTGGFVGGSG